MWYELSSEGSPCGIDGCDIFTCCDKAFKDHLRQYHPNDPLVKELLEETSKETPKLAIPSTGSEHEIKMAISIEVWCFGCNADGIELECTGFDGDNQPQFKCIHRLLMLKENCKPFLTVQTKGATKFE